MTLPLYSNDSLDLLTNSLRLNLSVDFILSSQRLDAQYT